MTNEFVGRRFHVAEGRFRMFPDREFDKEIKELALGIAIMTEYELRNNISTAIRYILDRQAMPRKAGKAERVHATTVVLDRMWRRYNER